MRVQLSDELAQYRELLLSILSEFHSMEDSHLGCMVAARHRRKLLAILTKLASSASYQAGTKKRELEKAVVGKVLKQHVIEPAQTKRAAPIVSMPREDLTLGICFD